jgi:DNA-binding beta-propeller fold protein YncE
VWVANKLDGSVMRVDPGLNRVVATIRVGAGIDSIAVGAGGVWVARSSSNVVMRIDPARNLVIRTIRVGPAETAVGGLAIGGQALWISGSRVTHPPGVAPGGFLDVDVSRVDPATEEVVGTTTLFETSGGVAFGAAAPLAVTPGAVWVSSSSSDSIYRVDTASSRVEMSLHLNAHPNGIATDGSGHVWVITNFQRTLWEISTFTNQVSRTVDLPGTPTGVAFAGGSIWLTMCGVTSTGKPSTPASP